MRILFALAFVAALVAGTTLRPDAEARPAVPLQPRTGEQIYAATCAACHLAAGEGNGETYPPLAGSEWVTGHEGRLVRVILHGLTGEIEVQGQTFAGVMPPWGASLNDAEVAAVSTYIRSAWGNKASPVTAAAVAQLRKAHADRTTPWTAAELAKFIPVSK